MKLASLSAKVAALLLTCLVFAAVAPMASADVLLSELCDPRYNYESDRYIEIWNSGSSSVDLTGWQVQAIGNGETIFTWYLSGSIAPGQAMVMGDATTVVDFPVDFPQEAWSDNTYTWNGKINDGARLKNGSGTVIDEVVAPDTLFENDTLVRNEGVTTPSTSYVAAEWTATPVYYPTDATPGAHWGTGVGPSVESVVTLPASPLAGEAVNIQATVADGAATITSVTLNWGTASGTLSSAINMSNVGGDLFQTDSAIPGQVAGTTVYYQVTAANDIPVETVTDEASYFLPIVATIPAIQGTGTTSPYVGQSVVTSGLVTAQVGSYYTIQDGSGARSGIWLQNGTALSVGDLVSGSALVQEINGNTVLTGGTLAAGGSSALPGPEILGTGAADGEDWEGVLVQVVNAPCTMDSEGALTWAVNDGSGTLYVDNLGMTPDLDLGTLYTITGPVSGFAGNQGGIVPRDAGDIVFVSDPAAPSILDVDAPSPTVITITFSETLNAATAQNAGNYSLAGESVLSAGLVTGHADMVSLTVSTMDIGSQSLTVDGVEDLYGNALSSELYTFDFTGGNIPEGYYDSAVGLTGEDLRLALHNIIDNHTVISYDGLWTAYYTTDAKPNGKVWDMYSDVPGGIPPYEYTFGVDQGGDSSAEGVGYNREHSWPSSWYGSSGPAYTDLYMVYPTDSRVNNMRSNNPYGEVDNPNWTSLNGGKRGPCSYPGYTGTAFEPIDEYKGDFARSYFYIATRYYTEDGSWSSSAMVNKSQLLPWAVAMLLEWHAADPVSEKEIDRNEAVYAIQHNRNPFIDRPDFVTKIYNPGPAPVEEDQIMVPLSATLFQNHPNPFNPSTTISYELDAPGAVDLQIYDVAGRLVRSLFSGSEGAGLQQKVWHGRDDLGRSVSSGVYFYRLRVGDEAQTRRMLLAK